VKNMHSICDHRKL